MQPGPCRGEGVLTGETLRAAVPMTLLCRASLAPRSPHLSPALAARLAAARGSPVKVWVNFPDKDLHSAAQRDAALAALAATHDSHAIRRRANRRTRPKLFGETDLPIAARYREAVRATGATIRVESPWLNAVSAYATPDQARKLAALPFDRSVEPVRAGRRAAGELPTAVPAPVGVQRC